MYTVFCIYMYTLETIYRFIVNKTSSENIVMFYYIHVRIHVLSMVFCKADAWAQETTKVFTGCKTSVDPIRKHRGGDGHVVFK
jgi:hypothetical protein